MDVREATPLLEQRYQDGSRHQIGRRLLWQLYVSHFLSTWNMRSYEFAVILLFASAYPQTLLPTSVRGVLTNAAALFLSPAVGNWVDRNACRFRTIKTTIVVQRVCIVAACWLWVGVFFLPAQDIRGLDSLPVPPRHPLLSKEILIALIILCSVVERVCAVGNQFVMERDWVPTIASESSEPRLHQLNAVMRRIDLISKILAPVCVSVIAVRTSPTVLAAATAGMNVATVAIELASAKAAWRKCAVLGRERDSKPEATLPGLGDQLEAGESGPDPEKSSLALYFSNDVCLASLSAALQSFSVLSLSGPMTTYLLSRHLSLSLITTARTLTSVLEISSTIVFPLAATFLSRFAPSRLVPDPVATLGLLGVSAQLLLLLPCAAALALLPLSAPPDGTGAGGPPLRTALLLFGSLGLSRVGHWTHNMAAQQAVQTRVPAAHRAGFSGVETAFVSAAEIGRWAAAAVWSRPEQFAGIGAAGLVSVGVCWVLFAVWVVRLRGKVLLGVL
ncbi:hypothetical protein NKR23_g10099 [Pleurostoma richardsiae]|uniref:Solute carrier family 40 member n=1 Tax=Pleurostoma richardsiae TaxID=41990 RepID=A0AA38R3G5_9PEZI|nr:hypothetical protein NKR23_g10099 [Pleurostoma richardsiae]